VTEQQDWHVVECGHQAQRPSQRVEHLERHVGLAALLQTAVVVGAQAGQHRQLFAAQSRDPPRSGKRLDAGLRGREPVSPGAQERSQGGAISWHPFTIRGSARRLGGPGMLRLDKAWLVSEPQRRT
jgi:hypothetical protein